MNQVKQAISQILADKKSYPTSLNWAIEYCRYAMTIQDPLELKVQCLYILNNIQHWRHPDAKGVRETLKKYTKEVF